MGNVERLESPSSGGPWTRGKGRPEEEHPQASNLGGWEGGRLGRRSSLERGVQPGLSPRKSVEAFESVGFECRSGVWVELELGALCMEDGCHLQGKVNIKARGNRRRRTVLLSPPPCGRWRRW